jgi:hypothetical protein
MVTMHVAQGVLCSGRSGRDPDEPLSCVVLLVCVCVCACVRACTGKRSSTSQCSEEQG